MNWLKRFLGMYDKQQKERSTVMDRYVEQKKIKYNKAMREIQKQAKDVHLKTRRAYHASIKHNRFVDDVVNKMATVTGGKRIRHG